jgi:hypothetical protein
MLPSTFSTDAIDGLLGPAKKGGKPSQGPGCGAHTEDAPQPGCPPGRADGQTTARRGNIDPEGKAERRGILKVEPIEG